MPQNLIHSPFALSSAVITCSSKAMLMSNSTKLLNVSFMVRVLRNRDANGTGGFNSKSVCVWEVKDQDEEREKMFILQSNQLISKPDLTRKVKRPPHHHRHRLLPQMKQWVKAPPSISSSSWVGALPWAWVVWDEAFGFGRLRKEALSSPAKFSPEHPCAPEQIKLYLWRMMFHITVEFKQFILLYLSEFMGLQRGFRLQTRTYSLLLTVSRNFTYTLW